MRAFLGKTRLKIQCLAGVARQTLCSAKCFVLCITSSQFFLAIATAVEAIIRGDALDRNAIAEMFLFVHDSRQDQGGFFLIATAAGEQQKQGSCEKVLHRRVQSESIENYYS